MLIDTHCHIHEADYPIGVSEVLSNAKTADVQKMICVGDNEDSSLRAIDFVNDHDSLFAAVGVHPHEVEKGWQQISSLAKQPKVVAIGEIGLDYHYDYGPRELQKEALKAQIQAAIDNNLPIIFHVREAFDDFWPIFDQFFEKQTIKGVIHSFTDTPFHANEAIKRGLLIGVGGYCTFTKDESQKEMFRTLPLDKIILETDAPFLTPVPFRGKINEPAFVGTIANYLADLRGTSVNEIANATSNNAQQLFNI